MKKFIEIAVVVASFISLLVMIFAFSYAAIVIVPSMVLSIIQCNLTKTKLSLVTAVLWGIILGMWLQLN